MRGSKLTLLYKLNTDYFSLCQSVILSVSSHEEIYLNICRNVRGVLTFVIHCIFEECIFRQQVVKASFIKDNGTLTFDVSSFVIFLLSGSSGKRIVPYLLLKRFRPY